MFQSFLDEVAHAAGMDTIEFNLNLLKSPLPGEGQGKVGGNDFAPGFLANRMIAVIERVREVSGWADRSRLPKGTGMGFGWNWSHLGYVAQVHQVRVDADGVITPERVWIAGDFGKHIINPTNAVNQMQGGVLDAISAALGQQITLDKGRVVQSNFQDYRLLRNRKIRKSMWCSCPRISRPRESAPRSVLDPGHSATPSSRPAASACQAAAERREADDISFWAPTCSRVSVACRDAGRHPLDQGRLRQRRTAADSTAPGHDHGHLLDA